MGMIPDISATQQLWLGMPTCNPFNFFILRYLTRISYHRQCQQSIFGRLSQLRTTVYSEVRRKFPKLLKLVSEMILGKGHPSLQIFLFLISSAMGSTWG